jgi:histidine ammonia-lyase
MTIETVRLQIPFESLVDAISSLGLEEKRRLWQLLDEEITQVEEYLLEEDPSIQAEIQEARSAYQTGDYQTIEEYIANRSGKTP